MAGGGGERRQEGRGDWREPLRGGQLRLRSLRLSSLPLSSCPPPAPWPGVDAITAKGLSSTCPKERGCLSAGWSSRHGKLPLRFLPLDRVLPTPRPHPPTGLRMPLLFWRTDSPHPGVLKGPQTLIAEVSWVSDATPLQVHTLNLDPQNFRM